MVFYIIFYKIYAWVGKLRKLSGVRALLKSTKKHWFFLDFSIASEGIVTFLNEEN